MRRTFDYATYLAALKRWFHGDQVPGELYKPEPIYHSLAAARTMPMAIGSTRMAT
jgi:hypothetical protein